MKKKRRSLEDNECFGSAHHPVALVVAVAQEPHSQSKTLPQEEEEEEEDEEEEEEEESNRAVAERPATEHVFMIGSTYRSNVSV